MWDEIYDRLVELVEQHRSTLVFVNTRRLSERISHHLAERLVKKMLQRTTEVSRAKCVWRPRKN